MGKYYWTDDELLILHNNYKLSGPKKCAELLNLKQRTVTHIAKKLNLKFDPLTQDEKNKEFIIKAIKVHGNKYDYSKTNYISMRKKIIITCPTHGDFIQIASSHIIHKQNCPICAKTKLTTEILINRFNEIHGDKYDYSLSKYTSNMCHIDIICKTHGVFNQRYDSHLKGYGCNKCLTSVGENKILKFLEKHDIKYIRQKTFDNCKYKKLLPFDFYLPEFNICIEFNGLQHYESIDYWGGLKGLEIRNIRDKIKIEYCQTNSIKLLIIKYNDNITKFLNNYFNEVNS